MYTGDIEAQLRHKFRRLAPFLDEKLRRLAAANEALTLGYGGIAIVARATGLSEPTIRAGMVELAEPDTVPSDRIRRTRRGPETLGGQRSHITGPFGCPDRACDPGGSGMSPAMDVEKRRETCGGAASARTCRESYDHPRSPQGSGVSPSK